MSWIFIITYTPLLCIKYIIKYIRKVKENHQSEEFDLRYELDNQLMLSIK